jgi:phosphoserine phosphatase
VHFPSLPATSATGRGAALVVLLGLAFASACAHTGPTVTTSQLLGMVRDEPMPAGHVACAAFDADGTLWDFDLSKTLAEQAVRDRTASELGLPAFNALFRTFGLPAAASIYDAKAELEAAWFSGQLHEAGRRRGWDEDAVNVREWPHYNWLFVGETPAALGARARRLMSEQGYRHKVFPGIRTLLAALRAARFRIRIVSGGVHELLEVAAADLGLAPDEVRGLRTEVRDGSLTAEVVAPVPYKQGKAELAEQMCGGVPMFAFGDSVASGDSAMLEAAAIPVAVRPKDRHLVAALDRGMRIWEHPEASR